MHNPDGLTDAQRGQLSETELTERLDTHGTLEAAHGPGCYALRVDVPDSLDKVRRQWDTVHDARPDDLPVLATPGDVAYVGASRHVYGRLCDHARGDVRTVTLLEAFDPLVVLQVWPHDQPYQHEYNHAVECRDLGWTVWCNGRVVG